MFETSSANVDISSIISTNNPVTTDDISSIISNTPVSTDDISSIISDTPVSTEDILHDKPVTVTGSVKGTRGRGKGRRGRSRGRVNSKNVRSVWPWHDDI